MKDRPKTGRRPRGRSAVDQAPSRSGAGRAADWTFLTNHAHVLLCISRAPEVRMREIADLVGITERAVQRIVADLVEEGYVRTERAGRRNVYHVNRTRPLRHSLERHRKVSSLLDLVSPARG